MKKILIVPLILACVRLFSFDLELSGGLGNLGFDPNRNSTLGGEAEPLAFRASYFPLALARLSGEWNGIAFNTGLEWDPILGKTLFGNFSVDLEYIEIEAGPCFGVFNSWKLPVNPGVSAGLKLQLPGVIFAQGSGSSTLAFINLDKTGSYSQYSGRAAIGFWVPYVICSVNMSVRNFTIRENENQLNEDESLRYFFRADVYTKNMPYVARVDLGYQSLKRSYASRIIDNGSIVSAAETDEFRFLFIGLEGCFALTHSLRILLGAEMPFYFWSVRPMKDPPEESLFFQARAGIIWTFG
jgi:hypothetical protein